MRAEFGTFARTGSAFKHSRHHLSGRSNVLPRKANAQNATSAAADSRKEKQALTHLHEELPLLHQGLASLAALLDHPAARQTQSRETHDHHKCCLGLSVLQLHESHVCFRSTSSFIFLHVQESVSHPPAALCTTENGSFKPAIKLPEWEPTAGFTHLAGRREASSAADGVGMSTHSTRSS